MGVISSLAPALLLGALSGRQVAQPALTAAQRDMQSRMAVLLSLPVESPALQMYSPACSRRGRPGVTHQAANETHQAQVVLRQQPAGLWPQAGSHLLHPATSAGSGGARLTLNARPTTPRELLPTAAAVPEQCVPWPLSSACLVRWVPNQRPCATLTGLLSSGWAAGHRRSSSAGCSAAYVGSGAPSPVTLVYAGSVGSGALPPEATHGAGLSSLQQQQSAMPVDLCQSDGPD